MISYFAIAAALTFPDVASLTRAEAAASREVCATGVVTQVVDWRRCAGILANVDDPDGRGIYFQGGETESQIKSGDVLEVTGVSTPLSFAPGIWAKTVRKIGSLDLPPFRERTLHDLDHGILDNARVKLKGVLCGVRDIPARRSGSGRHVVQLVLATRDGRFTAYVEGESAEWRKLLDAELEVCGCAMSAFNIRSEFAGVQMEVASPDDVAVVKEPSESPFSRVATPVAELTAYSPVPPDCHAKLVSGIVTFVDAKGRFFYLQDGTHGLKVDVADIAELEHGDTVEVLGFPVTIDGCGVFNAMDLRKTGHVQLPPPFYADLADYTRWQFYSTKGAINDYAWRRVIFNARVIRACDDGSSGESELFVTASNITCRVHFKGALPEWLKDAETMHPMAKIVGVAEPVFSEVLTDDRTPHVKSLSFAAAAPAEIHFLPDPEWKGRVNARRWRYALWVGLALLVAAFAAGVARMFKVNRERDRMGAVIRERKRMAADLHDTIEQHLAGISMLLKTAQRRTPNLPEHVSLAMSEAAQMLAQAKSEVRQTVLNLRSDDLFSRSPREVLRDVAAKLSRPGLYVRTCLPGLPESLPQNVFSDILLIVQEAATNAVKHGAASRIVLMSEPLADGFELRVLNDGTPFDAGTALGPEAGHYGLSTMRERAARSGIALSWGNEKKWTFVKLEVKS